MKAFIHLISAFAIKQITETERIKLSEGMSERYEQNETVFD